jgi:hypothetical protein
MGRLFPQEVTSDGETPEAEGREIEREDTPD